MEMATWAYASPLKSSYLSWPLHSPLPPVSLTEVFEQQLLTDCLQSSSCVPWPHVGAARQLLSSPVVGELKDDVLLLGAIAQKGQGVLVVLVVLLLEQLHA